MILSLHIDLTRFSPNGPVSITHPHHSQAGKKQKTRRKQEIKLATKVTRLFIHKVRRAALDKAARVTSHYDIFEAREAEEKLDYVVGVRSDGARGDSHFPQSHMDTILGEKAYSADTTIHSFISRASLRWGGRRRKTRITQLFQSLFKWNPGNRAAVVQRLGKKTLWLDCLILRRQHAHKKWTVSRFHIERTQRG